MGRICLTTVIIMMVFISVLFVGCSHNIQSNDNIARAQAAVENAQKSQAWTYDPLDIKTAQDKLDEARAAARRDDHERASWLADESAVAARLAEKKADAEKAKRVNAEMRQTIDTLRQSTGLPPR